METTIADKIQFAPDRLLGKWQPTTTIGWALKGITHFIVTMTWLLSICWWLLPILALYETILASYNDHKNRTNTWD